MGLKGEWIECPSCGAELWADRWSGELLVPVHSVRPGRVCEASVLSYEDALAVQLIRAEGGDRLRLAAHP